MNGMLPPHSWDAKLRYQEPIYTTGNLVCRVPRHTRWTPLPDRACFGLIFRSRFVAELVMTILASSLNFGEQLRNARLQSVAHGDRIIRRVLWTERAKNVADLLQ